MRPRRLELRAFGPFPGTEVVEFDRMAEAGLFLIHGETGAGKTSLIDAMCYALYGSVPGARTADDLRSDHAAASAAETSVSFEFSIRNEDWLVTRTPPHQRQKKRGAGVTAQRPHAVLSRREGQGWAPVAHGVEEVGHLLRSLLGLTAEQFQQVVVLPQGQFQEALRASPAERGRLLSALFRTERFAACTERLLERAKGLEAGADARAEQLARLADLAADRWAELGLGDTPSDAGGERAAHDNTRLARWARATAAAAEEAEGARRSATVAVDTARAALRDAAIVAERHERRRRAEATLAACRGDAPVIAALATELDNAERAAPIDVVVQALEAAEARMDRAIDERARRLAPVPEATVGVPEAAVPAIVGIRCWNIGSGPSAEAVLRACDAVRGAIPTLESLGERGQLAAEMAAEVAADMKVAAEAEAAAVDAERAAAGCEERIEAEEAAIMAAAVAGAGLEALRESADELVARAEAAAAAAAMQAEFDELAFRAEEAVGQARTSADHQVQLLERRLADIAGELSGSLTDGAPCPVCGSPEHPSPAARPSSPVDPADIDRADQEARFATEQARGLQDQLERARHELDELRSKAAGVDASEATERAGAVIDELRRAETAAARLPALEAAARERREEEAAARRRADSARQEAAGARARAERGKQEADTHADAVRGVFDGADPAVAATAAVYLLGLLDELREAVLAAQSARERYDEWTLELSRRAISLGFRSVQDALAARRSREEVEAGRALLADRRAAMAAASAQLDDASLTDLAPVPDLDALGAEVDRLAAIGDAAVACNERLRSAAAELSRLAERYEREAAGLVPLVEETTRVRRLADVCNGTGNERRMSLERYVLAAQLEQITAVASHRLESMSDGRYTLRHSDERVKGGGASGLSIVVQDAWTGAECDVRRLSGGETFQASLAFALAVADVVQQHAGGIHIDALFVDEGFGSLDPGALEQAMAELDRLRDGGRLVGIISHVAALHERITTGIEVVKAQAGSSVRIAAA